MASRTTTDPTDPIRRAAGEYAGVDEGTACTQRSFKVGKAAFLFIGEQGGRCKAMFKLDASRGEAQALARESPDDYQVGSGAWVTARFSADKPMPRRLWERWLKESYELSSGGGKKSIGKKAPAKKAASKKKGTRKKAGKTATRKAGPGSR